MSNPRYTSKPKEVKRVNPDQHKLNVVLGLIRNGKVDTHARIEGTSILYSLCDYNSYTVKYDPKIQKKRRYYKSKRNELTLDQVKKIFLELYPDEE